MAGAAPAGYPESVRFPGCRRRRQSQMKAGAATAARLAARVAAVFAHDGAYQRQSQSSTADGGSPAWHLVERFENAFALVCRNAGATVAYREIDVPTRTLKRYVDGCCCAAVTSRVFDQVGHGAAQQPRAPRCSNHGRGCEFDAGTRSFLGGQGGEVDVAKRVVRHGVGLEAAQKQYFLNQYVEFGDVARNFRTLA